MCCSLPTTTKFIETVANRIIELTPNGIIDKMMEYDEYITSDHIKENACAYVWR